MWYIAYCGDEKPQRIETNISQKWVYVRRNIERYQLEDETYGYRYEEMKLPKDVFEIFEAQESAESRIADIEEAITEIVGGI